jgi:hypothetical protein
MLKKLALVRSSNSSGSEQELPASFLKSAIPRHIASKSRHEEKVFPLKG